MKKSPFAGLVCVTTDQNGQSRTEVVQKSPKSAKTEEPKIVPPPPPPTKDASPQKKFKEKLDESLRKLRGDHDAKLDSFIVTTNKQVP